MFDRVAVKKQRNKNRRIWRSGKTKLKWAVVEDIDLPVVAASCCTPVAHTVATFAGHCARDMLTYGPSS